MFSQNESVEYNNTMKLAVADPDFELRKGGGGS